MTNNYIKATNTPGKYYVHYLCELSLNIVIRVYPVMGKCALCLIMVLNIRQRGNMLPSTALIRFNVANFKTLID